jgi:ATP-binding cassette subfamily B multidrug efflux pump
MVIMIPRAAVSAERIVEVLDTPSSLPPLGIPVRRRVTGMLELRRAGFAYPGADQPVLRNVSFTAGPGTTTAIIGSTGSGKTTLLGLVPRLFDVTGGAVLVDGANVRNFEPEQLWRRVGIVPQKSYLFTGTVASNLRYGNPDATDAQLWTALEVAQAAEFVRAMPGGLEAPIAQGGTNVSGGQRQRLAIARVLVRAPQIYLFDDSFSALDLATDARLRAALRRYTSTATVVVVAQRVASIRDADQIVVLDAGAVVGIGTHDELLATNPTYAEIVASQFRAESAA